MTYIRLSPILIDFCDTGFEAINDCVVIASHTYLMNISRNLFLFGKSIAFCRTVLTNTMWMYINGSMFMSITLRLQCILFSTFYFLWKKIYAINCVQRISSICQCTLRYVLINIDPLMVHWHWLCLLSIYFQKNEKKNSPNSIKLDQSHSVMVIYQWI